MKGMKSKKPAAKPSKKGGKSTKKSAGKGMMKGMMKGAKYCVLALALVFGAQAFAQVLQPVPEGDAFASLMALIANAKTMGGVAIGAAVVAIIAQLLKSPFVGGFFEKLDPKIKRLVVFVLGQLYGVLFMISQGVGAVQALLVAVFSSGGAVALYELIKPFFEKKA